MLMFLAFYVLGAEITYVLLTVMIRTVRALGVSHGMRERHAVIPALIWPYTVLMLGCWHETDARRWWE